MPTAAQIHDQHRGDYAAWKQLQAGGDQPRLPHDIDFHMLAETEAALTELARTADLLGFTITPVTTVGMADGSRKFSCYLRTKSTAQISIIGRFSVMMLALAEAYGCTYNGWGTLAVRDPNAGGGSAATG